MSQALNATSPIEFVVISIATMDGRTKQHVYPFHGDPQEIQQAITQSIIALLGRTEVLALEHPTVLYKAAQIVSIQFDGATADELTKGDRTMGFRPA